METIEGAANSTLANPISGGADQTCPRCWGHLRGELIQPRLWVYAVPVLCQAYQSPHPSFMIYSLYLIPELPEGVDFVSFILSNRKTFKSYVYQRRSRRMTPTAFPTLRATIHQNAYTLVHLSISTLIQSSHALYTVTYYHSMLRERDGMPFY